MERGKRRFKAHRMWLWRGWRATEYQTLADSRVLPPCFINHHHLSLMISEYHKLLPAIIDYHWFIDHYLLIRCCDEFWTRHRTPWSRGPAQVFLHNLPVFETPKLGEPKSYIFEKSVPSSVRSWFLCEFLFRGIAKKMCNMCHPSYVLSYVTHISETSYILHHASYIIHPTSYIMHPTSYIIHPTSYSLHHISYIIHRTSAVSIPLPRLFDSSLHFSAKQIQLYLVHLKPFVFSIATNV